jgi:hypothetical protein
MIFCGDACYKCKDVVKTLLIFITISPLSLSTNMDIKKQINLCLFMSTTFMLIKIKFHVDINNDEFLIITWSEHNKKENHH